MMCTKAGEAGFCYVMVNLERFSLLRIIRAMPHISIENRYNEIINHNRREQMEAGIFIEPLVTIYETAAKEKDSDTNRVTAIADEGLYGMGVRITGAKTAGFLPVMTHYGYHGYIESETIKRVTLAELQAYEAQALMVVAGACVDVLSLPKVQGLRLTTLLRGSLVVFIGLENPDWARIRLLDGRLGYIRAKLLREKLFFQSRLWEQELPQKVLQKEALFRREVTNTARQYLGVQYRWGGKSPLGIDCSGLTSMSYMLNGILIYRDARIVPGYPVKEIPAADAREGDLLYFPGHIALYLGAGYYLHSTGSKDQGGVMINSLDPAQQSFRADLKESLYAAGSIF